MTYSIVARDPDWASLPRGRRAVALVLGRSVVSWAEAGVGAVAMQSFAERSMARSDWAVDARAAP